jgi:hypothetical protein
MLGGAVFRDFGIQELGAPLLMGASVLPVLLPSIPAFQQEQNASTSWATGRLENAAILLS